jgi:hypothetical protein
MLVVRFTDEMEAERESLLFGVGASGNKRLSRIGMGTKNKIPVANNCNLPDLMGSALRPLGVCHNHISAMFTETGRRHL